MSEKDILSQSITALTGVGPKKAQGFAALGIYTVGDLLRHFPRAYQNRGDTLTLVEAANNRDAGKVAMILTVGSEPQTAALKNRMTITRFGAFDETGRIAVQYFNNKFISQVFHTGQTYRFYGKIELYRGAYVLNAPEYEPVTEQKPLVPYFPIYPLAAGLTQKMIHNTVMQLFSTVGDRLPEPIDEKYRAAAGVCSFSEAAQLIHRPNDPSDIEKARNYFIFEELFFFARTVLGARDARIGKSAPVMRAGQREIRDFCAMLPYTLTNAQTRVISEIAADLSKPTPMYRLLTGDVGSGKTVCAAAAAYFALRSDYQCALMVPTEILAKQHYDSLYQLFTNAGYTVALLCGSTTASEKKKIHEGIKSGAVDFVIGTHALIADGVQFKRAGLMIVDEQHRFGAGQRDALAAKSGLSGMEVHTLAMSATPIPRSLALVLYGDMDISQVDELPPGRQKVSTFLVDESYRARLEGFMEKQALEGHQVYVVCPAIESEDADEEIDSYIDMYGRVVEKRKLKSAVEYAEQLKARHKGMRVECMHGKMRSVDKDIIMGKFVAGDISVLVSTTVIEVGVNVPNATLMVVENAEMFGMSQLHQLRGRVGRGSSKSWCILVSDDPSQTARERLNSLCNSTDGYEIAKVDLSMRGPGDFIGAIGGKTRQSGELGLRIASLCDDTEMLMKAYSLAADSLNRTTNESKPTP